MDLRRLRFLELIVPVLSIVELCSWLFMLVAFITLQDIVPITLTAIGAVLNFVFNFITVRFLYSKEVEEKKQNSFVKYLIAFPSYKFYYLHYARFLDLNDEGFNPFGYVTSKHRKLFSLALLSTNLVAIVAAVINFISSDSEISLYCLDIDVICLSSFQACLVGFTFIKCRKCQIVGNTERKEKSKDSGRKKGLRKSGQTYIKSANDDTEEEDSHRSHKRKKTATNITHLNTSSQVLVDR